MTDGERKKISVTKIEGVIATLTLPDLRMMFMLPQPSQDSALFRISGVA